MSFKQKATLGFKWSFLDNFLRYIFTFAVSIILARLLEPKDFGLVAIVSVFGAVAKTLIDGGFGDSLIRKTNSDVADYNTVFTFNFIISIVLYVLLFSFSESIAYFFNEPPIKNIIRVSGLGLVISSFSMVQMTILRKQIEFKKQAKIAIFTTVFSGGLSILMAFSGFTYWALIVPGIASGILSAVMLSTSSAWKPRLTINFKLIKEHIAFGSKIMFGSFVNMLNQNIFNLFLGKFFSPTTLGHYYRADNIQKLPSSTLDNVIRHVTYPLLAEIKYDDELLNNKYRLILRFTSFFNSIILSGIAANSNFIVLFLFGTKWLPSVPYLQLLCFTGLLFPIISINLNILNVKGRSDLSLFLIISRLFFNIIALIIGYYLGIEIMIVAIIFSLLVEFLIAALINEKVIRYPLVSQIRDIRAGIFSGIIYGIVIFFLNDFFFISDRITSFLFFLTTNVVTIFILNEIFAIPEYKYFKKKVCSTLQSRKMWIRNF